METNEKFKRALKNKNLTTPGLAKITGNKGRAGFYKDIVDGKRHISDCSYKMVMLICEALDVTPEDLLEENEGEKGYDILSYETVEATIRKVKSHSKQVDDETYFMKMRMKNGDVAPIWTIETPEIREVNFLDINEDGTYTNFKATIAGEGLEPFVVFSRTDSDTKLFDYREDDTYLLTEESGSKGTLDFLENYKDIIRTVEDDRADDQVIGHFDFYNAINPKIVLIDSRDIMKREKARKKNRV